MKTLNTHLELNSTNKATDTITTLCHALPTETNQEESLWLPLIPCGNFGGRDGRSWNNNKPNDVVKNSTLPFILDIDHASETTANTVASGWVTELKIENNNILGKLELNSLGEQAVEDKRYKYYSPAFNVKADGTVHSFASVALTNKPNLNVPALNRKQDSENLPTEKENTSMLKDILLALGLSADADKATALDAIKALKTTTAKNSKQPDLNSFVPIATHQQVVTELNTVNQKLADLETAKHNEAVEVAINKAIADKKIAPANKDYYVGQCATEQGLASFIEFAEKTAPIIGESNLDDKAPNASETALNSEQKGLLGQLGLSVEDVKKVKDDK